MAHKVVYNACYGGLSLSERAGAWLIVNGSEETKQFLKTELEHDDDMSLREACNRWVETVPRHHNDLVSVVEAIGSKANCQFSKLEVKTLSGNKYWIEYYDGLETVHEPETIDWVTIEEE